MTSETKKTKRFTGRRVALVAAVVVLALALGVGAMAYSGVITSWTGHSRMEYPSLPTAQQAVRDAGYAPVLIEEFENGYAFAGGSLVDNALEEEVGGTVVESFKSFAFDYEKDGDRVMLSQMRYASEMDYTADVIATADGVDIRYLSYRNRLVAPDYQLTPEEQAAKDAGEIIFSYGWDDPEIHTVQSAEWDVGDMHYALTQVDGALTPDELVDMAREIIAAD